MQKKVIVKSKDELKDIIRNASNDADLAKLQRRHIRMVCK